MFGLGAAVYAIVAFFIVWAIVRGRGHETREGPVSDNAWIVWGGVVVPVVILGVLAVVTVQATSRVAQARGERAPGAGRRQALVVGRSAYPGDAVHDRERDPPARRAARSRSISIPTT